MRHAGAVDILVGVRSSTNDEYTNTRRRPDFEAERFPATFSQSVYPLSSLSKSDHISAFALSGSPNHYYESKATQPSKSLLSSLFF